MQPQSFRIERSISWIGLLVLLAYSLLACFLTRLLLPHHWRRLDFLGSLVVLCCHLVQRYYWLSGFKKGVRLMKQNKWAEAYDVFKACYYLFVNHPLSDRFRFLAAHFHFCPFGKGHVFAEYDLLPADAASSGTSRILLPRPPAIARWQSAFVAAA